MAACGGGSSGTTADTCATRSAGRRWDGQRCGTRNDPVDLDSAAGRTGLDGAVPRRLRVATGVPVDAGVVEEVISDCDACVPKTATAASSGVMM
jgi:hypothetical protein